MRKLLNIKYFLGLLIIGLFFVGGGLWGTLHKSTATSEATATIIKIDRVDIDEENYTYTVYVTYTDYNGVSHEAEANSYSSSYKVGSEIAIKYDIDNPEFVESDSTNILPLIALIVGAVAVIFSIIKIVIAFKKPIDDNDFNKVNMKEVNKEMIEDIKNNNEEVKEYNFYTTEGFKPNYVIETKEHEIIYEAICAKLGLFTKSKYEFVNHITGQDTIKEIGHTVSTSTGDDTFSVITDSKFKIDGVNCWDALGALGYSIDPHLEGVTVILDIAKYGVKVATAKTAGTNIATGKKFKLGNIPTKGYYTFSCKESDLDGIFLALFIASRTYN